MGTKKKQDSSPSISEPSLRDCDFPESLDTSSTDVAAALYVPALKASIRYDRGVGYFTSGWLTHAAEGLGTFAAGGGCMRLITSPYLTPEDWAAVKQGHDAREDPHILKALNGVIDDLEAAAKTDPLTVLAWMIADGLLEIEIAIPTGKLFGDFHPKIGVFEDVQGNFIAFNGSQNETAGGFRNYETLHVHLGWTKDRDAHHAHSIASRFNRLWNKHDPHVRCYEIPAAIRKRLVEFTRRTKRPYRREPQPSATKLSRWRHQDEALEKFLKTRAGVLAMATGTGKTRTALKIDAELRERYLVDFTIIAAFGTDLLDQWHRELIRHDSVELIYRSYEAHHEADGFAVAKRPAALLVNRRNLSDIITRLSSERIARTMIICDEVHGFGEAGLVSSLTGKLQRFPYRLGLSATPSREYDQDGNDFIEREIGPVIYRFDIHKAISRGILCELDYHPLEFQYSAEDKSALQRAWARHSARVRMGQTDRAQLFMDLAKVKKLSKEKLPVFKAYLDRNPAILRRCIIFVEEANYGRLVQDLLTPHRIEYHTYYGGDDRENLKKFACGEFDCVIACKRISEGIDIQSVNNVVLFATDKAPIQTVQRVGRCLRLDPKSPEKRATVVDFVRTDEEDDDNENPNAPLSTDGARRAWFEDLASVARNDNEGMTQ